MRPAQLDRSLTAIAGPPVLTVTTPTALATPGAIIVVGEYVHRDDDVYSAGQLLLWCIGQAYVNADTQPNPSHFTVPRGLVRPGVWWAYSRNPPPGTNTGIGRHPTSADRIFWWGGAMHAAVYDRTLTPQQAEAVARWLAQTLT